MNLEKLWTSRGMPRRREGGREGGRDGGREGGRAREKRLIQTHTYYSQ